MQLYQRMLIKDIQIHGIKESKIDENLKQQILLNSYYKCSLETTEQECDETCCRYKNECYRFCSCLRAENKEK